MSNRTNAMWFFIAFLGGGVAIWWTKGEFSDSPWLAAIVAAGVVLALIAYYLLNDEDAPEEEGDNVYYLGLLFTLISLMFSLVELFGIGTDTEPNSEKIHTLLKNFGIALTSTVVGIAGRVAVQNWQRNKPAGGPESTESINIPTLPPIGASPRDLEMFNRHLLGRIARDLTHGANALARFHKIVRSHASDSEDYLSAHSETLKQESIEFKNFLQHNVETFSQEIKSQAGETVDTVGASLEAVAKRVEIMLADLQSVHNNYLTEVRDTTRLFHDEIRSSSNQIFETIHRNIDTTSKQSLSLAQSLSIFNERAGEVLGSLGSGLEQAGEASAAFGEGANRAAECTAVLESEVDKLRVALSALHIGAKTMTSMVDVMNELNSRIRVDHDAEQTAMAVQKMGEAVQAITTETTEISNRTIKASELFDSLTTSVRATEDETRRAAEALRVLANEAEARINSLQQRQGSGFRFWDRGR